MRVTPTALPDVLLIEPRVYGDERGFFFESWNRRAFAEAGIEAEFVQDNHSRSGHNVLRGLHYQIEHAQGNRAGRQRLDDTGRASSCACAPVKSSTWR